jgi:hypothetical protein
MGWVLTASGSLAGPLDLVEKLPVPLLQADQRRIERPEIVDADTGAGLRLTAKAGGALQASLAWTDLDVAKVTQPNGDFHARLAGRQDLVVVVRTANRLRVTRGGQTASVAMDQADEEGLDLLQQLLAGSRAVRAFRGLNRRLNQESRESAPGVSLDGLDALLGILQGDPAAVDRRAPGRESGGRISRVACTLYRSCYAEYEAEVIAAWNDYAQCIDDVKWYPGLQEVCAFTWLIRAESAWFRFIGCSSIPLKVE